jgi:hypothetical protein
MQFDVQMDTSKSKLNEIFGITPERTKQLDKIMAHALIDANTTAGWIRNMARRAETLEELVLMVYCAGLKGGE